MLMAPRSIWNGTVSLGLVNVPIKLYTATESKTVHFYEVHVKDGSRIEHRRICPKDDVEVDYEHVVKGFEVSEGQFVVLEKEETKAAAGERGKLIEVEEFVDVAEIDPVFFEKTYYVGAGDDANAYRLLFEALKRSGRAGHRALHLPRSRVPRRAAGARRRAGAAHAALPRRGRDSGRPRPTERRAQADEARGRDGRPAGRLARAATSTRPTTRTATARRCST